MLYYCRQAPRKCAAADMPPITYGREGWELYITEMHMCGIIGAVTCNNGAAQSVLEGLKRLEYRGYDSAGISVLNGGKIITVKRGGRVDNLQKEAHKLCGKVAIGHTRWATHGAPTDVNAHPHICGKFAIAHNGIIENYAKLKEELCATGCKFLSETDSEVIAHLINFYYKGDPLKAVAQAVKRLKGSFALAVMCEGYEKIIAVKYKSPAVLGFAGGDVYLCSDVPALPACVNSICVPEDGDIAVIGGGEAELYDFDLNRVNRVRSAISLGQFGAGKGDFPHYMIKEIAEDGRAVKETAEAFFRCADVKRLGFYLREADRVIITGCGTAYNAGLVAKRYFEKSAKVFCNVELASELRDCPPDVSPKTLVIAVTQSGETADTVEAVCALKDRGARVVAVTNCGYSAITRIAHMVVPVCAGAEICVAATKSYLGQLAALYLIANLADGLLEAQSRVLRLADSFPEVLKEDGKAQEIADMCAKSSAVFFLGRAQDYAAAVEASLKLKEVSYVFSDAYPAGELKHGTLALIDGNTLSVFIICDDKVADKCLNAVQQVRSRGGKAVVISNIPRVVKAVEGNAVIWQLPECPAPLAPFLSACALQLTAYKTAVILKRDPDKPRNLAKSVTVE